jgi:actin-like ATPase involved in cell morphogenesis
MAEPVNVGLDFGSIGCRAMYVANGETVSLPAGKDWANPEHWLVCELASASLLGVRFPSLKSLLGIREPTPGSGSRSPSAAVRQMLIELRSAAQQHTGQATGQVVIAVPALYSSARRTTLRELALTTGFSDVHLLNDGTAAVIGSAGRSTKQRHVLVWSMGYGGFEVSLVRAVEGQYQTVGYEGSSEVSGASFDALLIRYCIQVLRDKQVWPAGFQPEAEFWFALRSAAQALKEAPSKTVTARAVGLDVVMNLSPEDFDRAVTQMLAPNVAAAGRVLKSSGLNSADLDEVMLVGGSTLIPAVQRVVAERFSHSPVLAREGAIARGAALYAGGLEGNSRTEAVLPVTQESEAETRPPMAPLPQSTSPTQRSASERPTRMRDAIFDLGIPKSKRETSSGLESAVEGRQFVLDYARRLIADGSYDRAAGFLEGLIEDIKAVLADIPRRHKADTLFHKCYDLLTVGRTAEAVAQSHHAYEQDRDNPAAFGRMIDIHCRAAMLYTAFEGYDTSMAFLACAHKHDATNRQLYDRIADRHFIQARELIARGDTQGGLKMLEHCLTWNPEHESGKALKAKLLES